MSNRDEDTGQPGAELMNRQPADEDGVEGTHGGLQSG